MSVFTRLFRGALGTALLVSATLSSLAQTSPPTSPFPQPSSSLPTRTPGQLRALQRAAYLYQEYRTQDPALGRVPTERLEAIRPLSTRQQRARQAAAPITWTERGPLGVTGTIRALLADPLDASRRKVWAGSLTAGLWVNGDISNADSVWRCVSDSWPNRAVSAIAADSANPQVRYAATGDLLSSMGPDGTGIYKSTNGGGTWTRLSATAPSSGTSLLQSSFARVSKLVVGRGSIVFAATQSGVVRSADGGNSWQFTLAPQQKIGTQVTTNGDDRMTDLELHRDGLLYAATGTGRIFRSLTTAGTSWTEVTPPSTAPYTGIRTELALGPLSATGPQVLYAINVAYDPDYGGYTTRWFRRSTDGGTTWSTLNKPVNTSFPDDDFTLGYGDQYLTLNAAPDDVNTINLSAYDQLYRSTDGGRTWTTGVFIDRTTALLQTPTQRVIWGGDVAIRHAAQMTTLARQGFTEAQNTRTKGFGGLTGVGLAMRNTLGSTYRLVGGNSDPGLVELIGSDNMSSVQVSYPAYPLRPYIDQDQPTLQIATTPGDGFLWRNTAQSNTWTYASTSLSTGNTALTDFSDYDSRSNTLFYWAGNYLRATFTGSGTAAPTFSALTINLGRPTVLRVGAATNTLYVATTDTKLYRVTNAHQSLPTVTVIDGNVFPANSTISSIDIGSTDNEIMVTLANYGIKSVWYSNNGGLTWVSKDESTYGLPDVPVYDALLNPNNRKQVMLATELGVWATDDISATNPGWTFSSTSALPIRTTQLVYRSVDGRVAAMTAGRGVWETNAWAIATPTSPTLVAGRLTQTSFCAGSTLPVPFTLTNGNNAAVQVRLSDEQGNFNNMPVLASSATSPISVTLPATATYGTRYRLRLEIPDLDLTTVISQTLTISDLPSKQPYVSDRRNAADTRLSSIRFTEGFTCATDSASLYANLPNRPAAPSATYRWAVDGQVLTAANSATLTTLRTGTYSFTVTEFGCSVSNSEGFLLKATNTPAPTVLNPLNDDGPICTGQRSPLVASYIGQRATYQWYRDNTAIPGTTSAVFSASQTGAYTYSLTMGTCGATTPAVVLTFDKAILASPIAVAGDVAPTLCGTNTVQLYATRQPDSTTYQWLRDGLPLDEQTGTELVVAQAGTYALQVQRNGCQAVSGPVSVSNSTQLSTGFYYYGSTTACTGESLTLYAKRYDQTRQWMRNGVDITGATGLTYQATTSGNYTLRATAGGCSATAVAVSLVFSQTITPALIADERCASIDLSTQDYPRNGANAPRFYWLKDGRPLANGLQSYQTVYESGTYSLSVSNGVCGGVSKPVSVTLGRPAPPLIQANGGTLRCPGSAVELLVQKGPYSFWKRNGTPIPNSNSYRYTATESGVYALVYQDGACTTESNALTVTFGEPAAATLSGRTLIQAGQSTTLSVGLTGLGPWSLTLSNGQTVNNITRSPYSFSITPTSSNSYSLVQVATNCGVGTVSGGARVFVGGADVSLDSWVNKRLTKVDSIVVQTVRVYNAGPDPATGLVLTNRLPAGVTYVGSTTAVGVASYTVGTLAAGQAVTYSLGLKTTRAGTFVNAVEVSACDTPDPDSQPNTGTGDGEDDAAQTTWRTADNSSYFAISPNPNGRILPAVASSQPAPVSNRADLSLALWTSSRTARRNADTIRVVIQVNNLGALATSNVRTSLVLPNGTFSTDGANWFSAAGTTSLSLVMGQIAANQSNRLTVFWIPTATGQLFSEVLSSSVTDPNSTPNNHATRPGEDDEGQVDVRVF